MCDLVQSGQERSTPPSHQLENTLPYISQADRPRVAFQGATNAGELNYELTLIIRAHLRDAAPLKYQHINDVVGALEHTKDSFRVSRGVADGKLAFQLWLTCKQYIHNYCDANAQPGGGGTYTLRPVVQAEQEVNGALECCKLEFYRRVAIPYEQAKCQLNGDVYTNE